MSDKLQALRVFIASPSDLGEERKAIKEVVDELNVSFGREVNWHIQLLGWEDTLPGFGRPQALINEDVDRADLFVGFLWRWWGSPSGHHEYSSGFEEEYHRALKRREQTNLPEICVFFKAVDASSLKDPGDHLQKILDFKAGLIQSKKLLFRDFRDIADWKDQTRILLQTHLLRVLKKTVTVAPQVQPQQLSEQAATDQNQISKGQAGTTQAARQEIIHLWHEVGEAIRKGELSEFDKSKALDRLKIARFGLATASIVNRDIESDLLSVHLINLLLRHRKEIALNPTEKTLVLRTSIGSHFDVTPGWFWLRNFSLNSNRAFIYFSCYDGNALVREGAIRLCEKIGFPLQKRSGRKQKPIEEICSHAEARTRKAGLEFLAVKGTAKDLPVAEKLRADSDSLSCIGREAFRQVQRQAQDRP